MSKILDQLGDAEVREEGRSPEKIDRTDRQTLRDAFDAADPIAMLHANDPKARGTMILLNDVDLSTSCRAVTFRHGRYGDDVRWFLLVEGWVGSSICAWLQDFRSPMGRVVGPQDVRKLDLRLLQDGDVVFACETEALMGMDYTESYRTDKLATFALCLACHPNCACGTWTSIGTPVITSLEELEAT